MNLGRVVDAITTGREEYELPEFFYVWPLEPDAVAYRQEVMRDMEDRALRGAVESFAGRMRTMRSCITTSSKSRCDLEKQRWHLAAVEAYLEAVEGLANDLRGLSPSSRGLHAFSADLTAYAHSPALVALSSEARGLVEALAAIRYCVLVRDGSVTVRHYNGEPDYTAAVEETFRKFQQDATRDHGRQFKDDPGLNHVEAQILDRVALLNPGVFAELRRFCDSNADFVQPTIARFDREIQFYAAYLDHVERFARAGLRFCYPRLSAERSGIFAFSTFDVALAEELLRDKRPVVCNDFVLEGVERVLIVTGPNQGGKTCFARAFGQLHYLASLGCPVPGQEARLLLCDNLFTHFEREENIASLQGRLEDELVRLRRILDCATPRSILVMNEVFSSTTLHDALSLGRSVLKRIEQLDLLCVWVTFLDELSTASKRAVSMVASVDPHDPAERTFKIARLPADGLAYALAIAEKHRVTHRWLRQRIRA